MVFDLNDQKNKVFLVGWWKTQVFFNSYREKNKVFLYINARKTKFFSPSNKKTLMFFYYSDDTIFSVIYWQNTLNIVVYRYKREH